MVGWFAGGQRTTESYYYDDDYNCWAVVRRRRVGAFSPPLNACLTMTTRPRVRRRAKRATAFERSS